VETAPTSSIVFAKVGEALYKNRRRILAQDTILDNNMMAIKAILPKLLISIVLRNAIRRFFLKLLFQELYHLSIKQSLEMYK